MKRYSKWLFALAVGFVATGGCSAREEGDAPDTPAAAAKLRLDGSGIRADALGIASWGDNVGFNCWFNVTNTGSDNTSYWEVDLQLPNATIAGGPWNAVVVATSGTTVTLRSNSDTSVMKPGDTISVSFNGAWSKTPHTSPSIVGVRRYGATPGAGGASSGGSSSGGSSITSGGHLSGGSSSAIGGALSGGAATSLGGSVSTGGSSNSSGGYTSVAGNSATGGSTDSTDPIGGSSGTGGSPGTPASEEFFIELASDLKPEQVALASYGGDGALVISDGVKLLVSPNQYADASALGTGNTDLGVATELGRLFSAGNVFVRGSHVHGDLTTAESLIPDPQRTSRIDGITRQHASLAPVRRLSWNIGFTSEGSAIELGEGEARTISPGTYGNISLPRDAHLTLSRPGIYIVNGSLAMYSGSVLTVENAASRVELYVRGSFIYQGAIHKTAAKPNFIIGVAGACDVPLEQPFDAILVAPHGSVQLGTSASGHTTSIYARSILARPSSIITQAKFVPNNLCTSGAPGGGLCAHSCSADSDCAASVACRGGVCGCATDGTGSCSLQEPCSKAADCEPGLACRNTTGTLKLCMRPATTCLSDTDCSASDVCGSGNGFFYGFPKGTNVCWPSACATMDGLGSQCGRFPRPCQADVDCPSGQVCGASNGSRFQYLSSRICWPAQCATDPVGTGCGSIYTPCGMCPSSCTPDCATKKCGDPPDDGCGGTCTGYCNSGCTSNAQCSQSVDHTICSPAAGPYFGLPSGQAACWYYACEVQAPSQRDCGTATSTCGPQCPSKEGQCANRQCGADPVFGTNCGTCATGKYCDPSGKCQSTSTDVVNVPVPLPPNQPTPAPTYQNPPKATDVGAIQGTLAVTSQGKAHYSVPLFVPPGVAGLSPILSLEYQSELQEGNLGVGWSVGGLSVIARCPRVYGQGGLQDPKSPIIGESAIHYDDKDQYCLDGNALVLVSSEMGDGAEYRTEQDSQIRVFVSLPNSDGGNSGPDHFDVYSPDGRVSRYGGRSKAPGYENSVATGTVSEWQNAGVNAIWALSHVEDLAANTIDYIYTLSTVYANPGSEQKLPWDPSTRMTSVKGTKPVISQILYGGTTSMPANRQVNFEWEDLSGVSQISGGYLPFVQRFGWFSGIPYRIDRRISTIGAYFEEYEVRKYILRYDDTDLRHSRLSSFYECAQGRCMQPTKFTYKPGDELHTTQPDLSQVYATNVGSSLLTVQAILDADDDGLPDLLLNPNLDPANKQNCNADFVFAHATGDRSDPYHYAPLPHGLSTCNCVLATDLDNDGQSEIYARSITDEFAAYQLTYDTVNNAWTQSAISYFTWLESCKNPPPSDLNGDGFVDVGPPAIEYPQPTFEIDTDGDGVANSIRSSVCYPSYEDNYWWGYKLADYDRSYTHVKESWLGFSLICPASSAADQDAHVRSQLVGSNAQQFELRNWATGLKLLDVNGDGLKDALTWSASAGTTNLPSSYLKLWINTGRNQFTVGQTVRSRMWSGDLSSLDAFLDAGTFQQAVVYDLDGNGLEDLLFMTSDWSSAIAALYAIPDAVNGANFQLGYAAKSGLPQWVRPTTRVLVLDVDGDGVSDLLMGEGNEQAVAYQKWVDHDLLDTVTDGNGRSASITYTSGKGAGVYTDTLPQTELSRPAHILPPTVQSITTTKGDGLTLTESYKYKEGRVGYFGRGFLGFTEINKTVTGSDVGVVSDEYTYYRPDTLVSERLGTSTDVSKLYVESGRPWKHVFVKHGIRSGVGASAKTVDEVVTETRTLMQILSPANVYMYLPWQKTVTTSEVDSQGHEQVFTTAATVYNYDDYGLPYVVTYSETGPAGVTLKARITSTEYERGQSFLDRNLIALPKTVSTTLTNAGSSVTHTEVFDYYDNGLPHHMTTEPNDSTLSVTTEYQYNDRGNVTSEIQTAGTVRRATDSFYDASGDFVQATSDPLLHMTAYSHYRGYGQIALTKDGNGLVSWRQIDSFGREVTATDANGNTVATSYEAPGPEATFLTGQGRHVASAVRKVYSDLSSSVKFYDNVGHVVGETKSDVDAGVAPLHTQSYYDSLGRKTGRSHTPFYDNGPSEQLDHIVYDTMNRPTSITIATDATPSKQMTYAMSYGHASEVVGSSVYADRAVVTTYPNQSKEIKVLDTDGRTLSLTDRNGNSVSFTYDATGGVTTFTDQANLTTYKGYDRYGRTVLATDPIRGVTRIQYTPLGDTVHSVTPTGDVTAHFDALNRIVDETTPEGTTTWTYDNEPGAVGRLVSVTGPITATAPSGHSVHYTYGPHTDTVGNRGMLRNELTTTGGETFAIDYDHDALGRISGIRYPALSSGLRYSVKNLYSPAGRLNAIIEGDGGHGRTLWRITARDSMGRATTEEAMSAMTTSYGYSDIDGLVTAMTMSEAGKPVAGVAYAYDFEHNLTSMAPLVAANSRVYQYDPGGRITDEFSGTPAAHSLIDHIDYSTNGNIAARSAVGQYSYSALNPYAVSSIAGGAFAYEYDPVGRVTKRTTPYAEGGPQSFTWTSFDAVRTITDARPIPIQTSFEYNGLKERVLETNRLQRKYRVGGVYQRTDELQSGNRLHSIQILAAGALVAEVQFTDDGKGLVGNPDVYSVRSDRLGSTMVVRDPSGNYITRSYDAFGNASDKTPLSSGIGFAGYHQDDENSLLWLTNRPYDPRIGRTLTPDAIINGGVGQDGANRYAYAYNRPTILVDPSGFFSISVPGWGSWIGGDTPGVTSNPISTVNPGGRWGVVMNTVINSPDDSTFPQHPISEYSNPLEARVGGQIIGFEPDQVPTDAQTETLAAAASIGDVGGDPGSVLNACPDCLAQNFGQSMPSPQDLEGMRDFLRINGYNHFAFGVSVGIDAQTWIGGSAGLNLEVTDAGVGLYWYGPMNMYDGDVTSGLSIGASVQVNAALGKGDNLTWNGQSYNYGFNVGSKSFQFFSSSPYSTSMCQASGWTGVSGGYSLPWGLDLGAYRNQTFYSPIKIWAW